jgi:hypothetical protein
MQFQSTKIPTSPLAFFATIFLLLVGCRRGEAGGIKIISKNILDSIPSGSGLVLKGDAVYIVGDDATSVYRLNTKSNGYGKIPVTGLDDRQYREPKLVKHDFESATAVAWKGQEYLLSFGSGSNSTSRDSIMMMNLEDNRDNRIISLREFYHQLRAKTGSDTSQWNIEGATIAGSMLVLLNRGNNLVIQLPIKDMMSFLLEKGTVFPGVAFDRVVLPTIGSHEARFSGACTLNNAFLLFAASVEDTPDWTKDGPILGSIIGVYSLPENRVVASYVLKDERGSILKEKIESLDITSMETGRRVRCIAIGDNDNATSTLWRLEIRLPAGVNALK